MGWKTRKAALCCGHTRPDQVGIFELHQSLINLIHACSIEFLFLLFFSLGWNLIFSEKEKSGFINLVSRYLRYVRRSYIYAIISVWLISSSIFFNFYIRILDRFIRWNKYIRCNYVPCIYNCEAYPNIYIYIHDHEKSKF